MHLMLPLHFVGAEHFPKENVQQSKMLQMRFCKATRPIDFQKIGKSIYILEIKYRKLKT